MINSFIFISLLSLNSFAETKTKLFCEFFLYSNCPAICEKECRASSCTGEVCTSDCDGPQSCTYTGMEEKKFDMNQKDSFGRTALMEVFRYHNSIAKIDTLLLLGADINARDNEGRTPLMNAVASSASLEVIKFLIQKGADIKSTDNYGNSVLTLSRPDSNRLNVVKFLVSKDLDPLARNKHGDGVLSSTQCDGDAVYKYWKSVGVNLADPKQGQAALSNCMALAFPLGLKGLRYLLTQGAPLPDNWEIFMEPRYVSEVKKLIQNKKKIKRPSKNY